MAVWFPFTSNLGLKPEKCHFHYCLVNGDSHTVMDHDTSSPLYGLLFHHVSPMIISWGENWMQLFWRGKFTGNPHRSILQKKKLCFRFSDFHVPTLWISITFHSGRSFTEWHWQFKIHYQWRQFMGQSDNQLLFWEIFQPCLT